MSNSSFVSMTPNQTSLILNNLPNEWLGTTFRNDTGFYVGRTAFATAVDNITATATTVTADALTKCGNAEDYFRVASNVSTILELSFAKSLGTEVDRVYTFGSNTFPYIATGIANPGKKVHVYHTANGEPPVVLVDNKDWLKPLDCNITFHTEALTQHADDNALVLISVANLSSLPEDLTGIDGIISPSQSVLYIPATSRIVPSTVLRVRKRLSTPLTTPLCTHHLTLAANLPSTLPVAPSPAAVLEFNTHLQTMSGTPANPTCPPITFTAGLPAITALWLTLVNTGGADIVMASTAYGGSSELTDIFSRSDMFNKHKYDITGQNEMLPAIQLTLDAMIANPSTLPRTVLFCEIPTNPDMKVPDITKLSNMLVNYEASTGKTVILMVDTTFAPASKVLQKLTDIDSSITSMVFISLSKSVSRGKTCAGTLVPGCSQGSIELVDSVRPYATLLGTTATDDQMAFLCKNHGGVEQRCKDAYVNAVTVGNAVCKKVLEMTGRKMELAFVKPDDAGIGFTSSTFSFNLPPVPGDALEDNLELAQRFVDLLTKHDGFKPCVSFGQDNDLVYCTVPATSTQGAISLEDKAKQAVEGVQLTRLSFPVKCELEEVVRVVEGAAETCYKK